MGDSKTCRLDLLVGDMRAFKSRFQVSGFKQWVYGVFKNIALRGIVEARFEARCFVDFILDSKIKHTHNQKAVLYLGCVLLFTQSLSFN